MTKQLKKQMLVTHLCDERVAEGHKKRSLQA